MIVEHCEHWWFCHQQVGQKKQKQSESYGIYSQALHWHNHQWHFGYPKNFLALEGATILSFEVFNQVGPFKKIPIKSSLGKFILVPKLSFFMISTTKMKCRYLYYDEICYKDYRFLGDSKRDWGIINYIAYLSGHISKLP